MNGYVFRPRELHQIARYVVERVAVNVVNDSPTDARPDALFIDNVSPLTPDVRLGHLDECPLIAVSLMSRANPHGADRQMITRLHPGGKGAGLCAAAPRPFGVSTCHRAERSSRFAMRKRSGAIGADVLNHRP